MALRVTEDGIRGSLQKQLRPGEELLTCGYGYRAGTKYFFVGLTPQKVILQQVSFTQKPKGTEIIDIANIESAETEEGFKYAMPAQKALSKAAEHSIVIKTKDGQKHVFRFGNIAGMDNRNCPDRMLEFINRKLESGQA